MIDRALNSLMYINSLLNSKKKTFYGGANSLTRKISKQGQQNIAIVEF